MEQDELTYSIIGCAMKVHNILGNGFQERIYQKSLAIEFEEAAVVFRREVTRQLYYRGHNVGARRADFVVGNAVIVEIKAVIELLPVHIAQAKNYLKAYNFDRGLLINFGSTSLQYKRMYNPMYRGGGG